MRTMQTQPKSISMNHRLITSQAFVLDRRHTFKQVRMWLKEVGLVVHASRTCVYWEVIYNKIDIPTL